VSLFFAKSLFALVLLALAAYGTLTMFSVFGGGAEMDAAERLKKRHKIAGYLYAALLLLLSWLCIGFLAASKAELSPRAALHTLLALSLIALLLVKVLFVRVFRQLYANARTIGIMIGIMTFVLVAMSAGFYLVVSRFGQDRTTDKSISYAVRGPILTVVKTGQPGVAALRTDRPSIERGRTFFASRCAACHDPESTRTIVGPGLKGLLRNPSLPASGHPATAESIRFQLRQPLGRMPSFAYLSDEEMSDLLAYLNTL
jgi:mono/diheme cytochrome c family protein